MAKSASSGRLSPEAEDIITLGRLLKQQRDEERRRAVDVIVASGLTVREKIQEIQKLDAGGTQVPEEENGGSQRTRPLRYRVPALADILKKPYARIPYLSYLFGDYRSILSFGKFTLVFTPVRFFPDVKLGQAVPLLLSRDLRQWAAELSDIVSMGLEDSWHYLRKIEYNLLVVMRQLCEKILSINFNLFDYKDPYLLNKLRSLEALFLVFHYREYYQELLQFSLQQIVKNDPRVGDKYETAVDLIHKILHNDGSTPSLYNIILGLNMLKDRRYLTMRDILCTDLGELINTKDFACPPDVKEKIRALVADGRCRLAELRSHLEKTKKLKTFLTLNESGEVSFDPLQFFYDQVNSVGEESAFAADGEDILRFVPRFFDTLDRTFAPLLNGQTDLEGIGAITLFTHDFFQLDFLRIRRIAGRVWDYSEDELPRTRFLDLQHSTKGIQSLEAEILKQVNEGLEVIFEMAKKVETILNTCRKSGGRPTGPLDPMILHGKSFSISHGKRRILSTGVLNGNTVVESLTYFVSICFAIGVFYHYPPVYDPLEREPRNSKELRSELEILNRLAGPDPISGLEHLPHPRSQWPEARQPRGRS
jgi:hypothetical protein